MGAEPRRQPSVRPATPVNGTGHTLRVTAGAGVGVDHQDSAGQRLEARLLNAVGEAIIATDPAGIITYANEAAAALYGWSRTEMLGRSIAETTVTEEMVDIAAKIMEQLNAGRVWSGEFPVCRKDGSRFWVHATDTPVHDEDGTLVAIIGISRDISDRRAAEANLASREHWFRTLVASSTDLIVVVDGRARILFANPAAETFIGTPAQPGRAGGLDRVHVDDRATVAMLAQQVAQRDRHAVLSGSFRVSEPNGDWHVFEVTLTNCLSDPAIAGIVVNARDATERTNLTRALRTLGEANQVLVRSSDEQTLLDDTCETAVVSGGYALASVAYLPRSGETAVHIAASAGRAGYLAHPEVNDVQGRDPVTAAMRTGCRQVEQDLRSASPAAPWAAVAAEHGLQAACAFPLKVGSDVIGALTIYAAEAGAFTAAVVELLDDLAADLAYGISRLRDLEHLTNSLDELLFRAQLLDSAGEAIIATDPAGRITYVNRAAELMFGFLRHELIGSFPHERIRLTETRGRAGSGTVRGRSMVPWAGDYQYTHADGTTFWAHATTTVATNDRDSSAGLITVLTNVTERFEARRLFIQQADITSLIAADADVVDVLSAISELAADGAEGTAVTFCFDDPDFQYGAAVGAVDVAGESIAITVMDAVVGSMQVLDTPPHKPRASYAALRLARAAYLAALVAQREMSKSKLRHQALHDPLTDLANRALLTDRIGRAMTVDSAPVTLLIIGVDHLKLINDGLGHDAGDRVLQCLARRFAVSAGARHTLSRFAGDVFAVLIDNPATDLTAVRLAERLLATAQEPIEVGDHQLRVTVSVGVAARTADTDPSAIVADASAALDDAKRSGRNRIVVSGISNRRDAEDRLSLEQDLRSGIPRGELVGYLQPVLNLTTGAVGGAEVLARWQHPARGLLVPADFVPWAEQTDLIEGVGSAMLDIACADLVALGPNADIVLSVNASTREITDPGYAARALGVIRRYGLSPTRVAIELTESIVIGDVDRVHSNLAELRAAGVAIYLDDFGTGYSSLTYLRQLPIDVLKIDRSFVMAMTDDPKAAEVVGAVAALARALALVTIAEGVETAAQARALAAIGVDFGQGELYAEPRTLADFAMWMAERRSSSGDADPAAWATPVTEPVNGARQSVDGVSARPPRRGSLRAGVSAPRHLVVFAQAGRALLRASTAEQVSAACCAAVYALGGSVSATPVDGAPALATDLSFGHGPPQFATAPTPAICHALIAVLPDLIDDAHACIARVQSSTALANQAMTDGLTGLLNRRALDRVLTRIKAGDVVLFMDLDDLKAINDDSGHAAGDLVLTAFAGVLREQTRASDQVGRFGGDEFVAILHDDTLTEAAALLARIRATWKGVSPRPVTFSAGLAQAQRRGDSEGVLAAADRALYQDKASRDRQLISKRVAGASEAGVDTVDEARRL